jgi:hypothetical protein
MSPALHQPHHTAIEGCPKMRPPSGAPQRNLRRRKRICACFSDLSKLMRTSLRLLSSRRRSRVLRTCCSGAVRRSLYKAHFHCRSHNPSSSNYRSLCMSAGRGSRGTMPRALRSRHNPSAGSNRCRDFPRTGNNYQCICILHRSTRGTDCTKRKSHCRCDRNHRRTALCRSCRCQPSNNHRR